MWEDVFQVLNIYLRNELRHSSTGNFRERTATNHGFSYIFFKYLGYLLIFIDQNII